MAVRVDMSDRATRQFAKLDTTVQQVVEAKVQRLALYPEVSGIIALQGTESGRYRIHAGNHRVFFRIEGGVLTVIDITDRKDSYTKKGKRGRSERDVSVRVNLRLKEGANNASAQMRKMLGKNLRDARLHAGLSQADLAKRIHRSQAAVSGAEKGKFGVSAEYVRLVLRACGVSPHWPNARRP